MYKSTVNRGLTITRYISLVLAAGIVLFALGACSSDGTSELKSLLNDQADIIEGFAGRMENAKSSEDMAKAIEGYTAEMKELIPRLKSFQEKYPDLAKREKVAEFKDEAERVQQASAKLSSAMMNSLQYMMAPRVQQAMEKMAEEVGEMK